MRNLINRIVAAISDDQNARIADEFFMWFGLSLGVVCLYLFTIGATK